jgi:general secretion pathway protein K
VRIKIFDESGKLDINTTQENGLRAVLKKALEDDQDRADSISDAILDWRDQDDQTRLHGAEASEYQSVNRGYGPSNQNFQALEELQMVLGITPALFRKLERSLTVYSGQNGINPQKASLEALLNLPGVDLATAQDYVSRREQSPNNVPVPFPVTIEGVQMAGGGEFSYTIRCEAQGPGGNLAGVSAVVRRQPGRDGLPFSIISWRQLSPGQDLPDSVNQAPNY